MSISTADVLPAGGKPVAPTLDHTYRKVTLRLIPFLAILWILAWLDRVNIGFAKLQMLDDLKFSEAIYGLGAGIFFLGYFFFEVPSNLLLEKFGAKKTIMRITIGWGITSIIMMFVTTPGMFYFLRFLLGVFEAGFYPGIVLYLTYWFPTDRRAKAFGMFMSASALAGVIGGPLAGGIMSNLSGVNGWNGWQWLFLLEGIPSVIAGVVTFFYLTDKPEQAKWLTAEERRLLREDLDQDNQGQGHREHSIMAGLKDRRVWLLIAIYFCLLCGNSTLTFWAPSVIRDVGFASPVTIGWIASVAYLLGACGMIWNGAHSDRHQEVRYHFGLAALLGSIGMLLLGSFINVSALPTLLAMTVGIVGTMSAIPVFWQLPARFLSGAAAAAGIALINSIANLAGAGSPYMMGLIKTATGTQAMGWFIIAAIQLIAVVLVLKFIPKLPAPKGPKQHFH
jgi:D-galactonate transporter